MALKSKKKSKKGMLITIAVVVIAAGVCVTSVISSKGKNVYSEIGVKKASIETYYNFSANVESKNSQSIMAQRAMEISDIKVDEGEKVDDGDVIFKTSDGESIKSKIDGTVCNLDAKENNSVVAGTKLCDVIDLNNLQIKIKVDEYDLASIKKGKEISVSIGAINKVVKGTVESISDTATNENGVAYFTATVSLSKDDSVKVGMNGEAKILNKSATNVLTVPMDTLQFDESEKPYVLVKDGKGSPVKKEIKVGVNDGKNVEIKEGLTEKDVVMYKKISGSTSNSNKLPIGPGRVEG